MTAADVLRSQLEAVGGLTSRGELAAAWGWTRSHVHMLSQRPDFPAPVTTIAGRPLYARAEAQAWHERYVSELEATRSDPRGLGDGLGA